MRERRRATCAAPMEDADEGRPRHGRDARNTRRPPCWLMRPAPSAAIAAHAKPCAVDPSNRSIDAMPAADRFIAPDALRRRPNGSGAGRDRRIVAGASLASRIASDGPGELMTDEAEKTMRRDTSGRAILRRPVDLAGRVPVGAPRTDCHRLLIRCRRDQHPTVEAPLAARRAMPVRRRACRCVADAHVGARRPRAAPLGRSAGRLRGATGATASATVRAPQHEECR